jgi:hypothetical protein
MLEVANAQIAVATMAEISSVLCWTILQWAGYPRDKKVQRRTVHSTHKDWQSTQRALSSWPGRSAEL